MGQENQSQLRDSLAGSSCPKSFCRTLRDGRRRKNGDESRRQLAALVGGHEIFAWHQEPRTGESVVQISRMSRMSTLRIRVIRAICGQFFCARQMGSTVCKTGVICTTCQCLATVDRQSFANPCGVSHDGPARCGQRWTSALGLNFATCGTVMCRSFDQWVSESSRRVAVRLPWCFATKGFYNA